MMVVYSEPTGAEKITLKKAAAKLKITQAIQVLKQMVENLNPTDKRKALSNRNQTSGKPENLNLIHKLIGRLARLLVVAMIFGVSACSIKVPALPGVPFLGSNNGEITISGELNYQERAAIYTGSIAKLVICNDSASDCGEVVAQRDLLVGGLKVPLPFEITVASDKISSGADYSLRVTVTGATGRVSWITIESFTVDASSIDSESVVYNLGTVNLVRPDAFRNATNRAVPSIATQ